MTWRDGSRASAASPDETPRFAYGQMQFDLGMPDPTPSPINDVAKLDLLVERNDGSIEMCVIAQGPVDGGADTLGRIEKKIRNYVQEALDESFRAAYGGIPIEKVRILFESRFPVDLAVPSLISRLASEMAQAGIEIKFREYGASQDVPANDATRTQD